ncbi:hypothetical protein BD414DRAFT_582068 [Trametes punicea]|nr:hypothetical protein BD414DRAFT_582068 [Trametes punicea]
MSDLGYNVWGVIASVIGILALVPAFLAWLQTRLPTTIMPGLIEVHRETQELFSSALREGLIIDPNDLNLYSINLVEATIGVDGLRAEVYAIKTWLEDVAKWWNGLSGNISMLRQNLNELRVQLAERNSKERKKLAARDLDGSLPSYHGYRGPELTKTRMAPCQCSRPAENNRADAMDTNLRTSEIFVSHDGSGNDHRIGPSTEGVSLSPCAGHHMISDADMRGLLSFALDRPRRHRHRFRRARLSKGTLQTGEKPVATHVALRTRYHALLRLVRRMYGVRCDPTSVSEAPIQRDPESLKPHIIGDEDRHGNSDEWDEEA